MPEDRARSQSIKWRRPQQQQLQLRGAQESPRPYFTNNSGLLTPSTHPFMPQYSMIMPSYQQSGLHHAQPIRGRSWEPPRGHMFVGQIYTSRPVMRSRSGTPHREHSQLYAAHKAASLPAGLLVPYAGKPTSAYSQQPTLHKTLLQVPSPNRPRTGMTPITPVTPVSSIPKAAAQAVPVSASAALAKEQVDTLAPSLSCTLKHIPQAQSQPIGQSAQPTGEATTEQLKQAVNAKLQAHQVTQTQASLAVPRSSQIRQPHMSSMMTQTDSQDLIKTTQLSAESVQELAIPRLSMEDQKAESLLLQQSYQDALRDLQASRQEKQELQDQFEKAQAENQSLQRDRERAEKELTAKCDKRDQANRKLEGEKRILESTHATLLKKLSDSQEVLDRVQGDLHRAQSNFDEEAGNLRGQVRQLTSELKSAESKASLQCREQIQNEQEARRELEVQNQSQRWQIEELHGHIVELKRVIDSLQQERKCSPDLLAPLPPTVEENHRLRLKLAEAQAELDNTLRQLKRQQVHNKGAC
eukprot:TRINITY_DN104103_c0_g1_i1.p1 TRINITY_DN104103_c0_g1~~TRINITY_DN104103_c0_g1_i1.p1  ORF type:complete len:599 (-),score=93.35 TRINITY_DN104103_c0_g1_i1:165-1742(-)